MKENSKGFVILYVLLLLSIIFFILISLVSNQNSIERNMVNYLYYLQCKDCIMSIVSFVSKELIKDKQNSSIDSFQEDWYKLLNEKEFYFSNTQVRAKLYIEDEESKFNCNFVLKKNGKKDEVGLEILNRLLDWIPESNSITEILVKKLKGESDSRYVGITGKLTILPQLLSIKDVAKYYWEEQNKRKTIPKLLTVYTDGKINLNTAKKDVLKAIFDNSSVVDTIIESRDKEAFKKPEDIKKVARIAPSYYNKVERFLGIKSDVFKLSIHTYKKGFFLNGEIILERGEDKCRLRYFSLN